MYVLSHSRELLGKRVAAIWARIYDTSHPQLCTKTLHEDYAVSLISC